MMAIDVLIVDDDRLNRKVLQRYIEGAGYATRLAESGEQALEMYEAKCPDVVLLDVMMPGIDGYETARRMKSGLGEQYVPILMLSALTGPQSIADGLAAGADDFLSKPYRREELEARIQAALRTQRLFNSLAEKKSELQRLHERSQRDQVLAERVMAASLRSELLNAPFLRYRSVPAEVFNGDVLMAESTPSGRVRVMLADFSGHGLAAAIGSQPVAAIFRAMTRKGLPAQQVMRVANTQLKAFLPTEMFLAMCIVEIDPASSSMTVLNAGMPPVFLWRPKEGIAQRLVSSYVPLGVLDTIGFEPSAPVDFGPGDRIYMHSDGLIESMDAHDVEFGEERLIAELGPHECGGSLFDAVQDAHKQFVENGNVVDDVTFVEISYDSSMRALKPNHAGLGMDMYLAVEFGPQMLSKHEPVHLVTKLLDSFPAVRDAPNVPLVLHELFNNAVDHGVLGLDSKIKRGPEGFERYYDLRDEKLRNLTSGRVRCEIELRRGDAPAIVLRVEDSGAGFDIKRRCSRGADDKDSPLLHGRGITLAEELCRELNYLGNGNRVEAVLDVPPAMLEVDESIVLDAI